MDAMGRRAGDARVPLPGEVVARLAAGRSDGDCARWADQVAHRIDTACHGVVIPFSAVCDDDATAAVLARAAAEEIVAALRRRWSLHALAVEYGAPQTTGVAPGKRTRTLLPHHDGGNSSYLTPSRLDLADWRIEDRRTSPARVTTTRAHKLYQGFLVRNAGEAESLTSYYDLLAMMMTAFAHRSGAAWPDVAALVRDCAGNLRHAIARLRAWGGGYVQLGALLGVRDPKYLLVNLHNIDDAFSAAELAAFPQIGNLGRDGASPAMALFDAMIRDATGLSWSQLCARTERCVESRARDLVLGHNILLMHGALRGGADRLLEPICAVLDEPAGEAYERWLSEAWRTAYRRADAALRGAR
jgi:hypothetical protein